MRFIRHNWIKFFITLYLTLVVFPLIIGKKFTNSLSCPINPMSLPLCTLQGLYGIVGYTYALQKATQLQGWDYWFGWSFAVLAWVEFFVVLGILTVLVFAFTESIKRKLNKQKTKK